MKILKLRFKNINSLVGENEIDFTNPVFTNNGLFAITGKTGSGKSSILDAICLALYGRTPRVKVSASENAVMTKGETDCYAEIIFEVSGIRWKSSWKQEFNRNGKLRAVSRTLADAADVIIEEKATACDNRIVEIIKLTFEQFTKVILLAQGSFAAFLEAEKNTKGEILEQITGTEIYTDISKRVFERNKSEEEKLKIINIELESLKILSEEDVLKIKNDVKDLESEKNSINGALQLVNTAISWLNEIEALTNNINQINNLLPELNRKAIESKATLESSEILLNGLKADLEKQSPDFIKTRELDTKISEKNNSLNPVLKSISEINKEINSLSKEIEDQNEILDTSKGLLSERNTWIADNKNYEELVSNYSAIELEKSQLDEESNYINSLKNSIDKLQADLKDLNEIELTAINCFNEKNSEKEEKKEGLETKRTELREVLNGQTINELQTKKESLIKLISLTQNLIEIKSFIKSNNENINSLENDINQYTNDEKKSTETIDSLKIKNTELESKISLLDENIVFAKTILSLAEHRNNLKDGQDCPLCGSTEHPYALGNIPVFDEKENELKKLKKELSEKEEELRQEQLKLVNITSNSSNASQNKQKEENDLSDNISKQNLIITEINNSYPELTPTIGTINLDNLQIFIQEKLDEKKEADTVLITANAIQESITTLRDEEIPELERNTSVLEKAKNEAINAREKVENELQNKKREQTEKDERFNTKNTSFQKKLNHYKVDTIEELKYCLNEWNLNQEQIGKLTTAITEVEKSIGIKEKDLENKNNLLSDYQKNKSNIESEIHDLTEKRVSLFSNKSVDEEENKLKNKIKESEDTKTSDENKFKLCQSEFEKNQAILNKYESDLKTKEAQKVTEKNIEDLQKELDELNEKSESCLKSIGEKNNELALNENNLKASGNKYKEKEQQEIICNNWGSLSNLIGSADGKLYRNFAQALTFEHLVGYTNIQLNKMTNRYDLKRKNTEDYNNPFELSVIDKFNNCEERTIENISGGEKFIISLSLALGLANMVSKKMSIDTMFIDEGFGTLDSEYLDVALNALSNLQSEGKVIGIISHITELKERIATHIEVIPGGNGHSRIQITN
jgi:exonuclease SbcC